MNGTHPSLGIVTTTTVAPIRSRAIRIPFRLNTNCPVIVTTLDMDRLGVLEINWVDTAGILVVVGFLPDLVFAVLVAEPLDPPGIEGRDCGGSCEEREDARDSHFGGRGQGDGMEVDKGVVVGICIEDLKPIFVAPKPSEVLLRFRGSSPSRALTGSQSGHRIGDTVRARQSFIQLPGSASWWTPVYTR